MDDEETLTAYHEAGHAVIAYALGGTVDSMQLCRVNKPLVPLSVNEAQVLTNVPSMGGWRAAGCNRKLSHEADGPRTDD